jgi:hypothetical protein
MAEHEPLIQIPPPVDQEDGELSDDELEVVVGGLRRVLLLGTEIAELGRVEAWVDRA